MLEHKKPWKPLKVEEVSLLFAGTPFPWWIAGGFALDLAVGYPIRPHSDIDVLILHRDHLAARRLLFDWDCWAADPPGTLRPWLLAEPLGESVHDIWCRRTPTDSWRIQLMLDQADTSEWVSRRDDIIRAGIESITRTTPAGIPYLAPHIQLFYKAKHQREKDDIDFNAVLNSGIDLNISWLKHAISHTCGAHHPWLKRLES